LVNDDEEDGKPVSAKDYVTRSDLRLRELTWCPRRSTARIERSASAWRGCAAISTRSLASQRSILQNLMEAMIGEAVASDAGAV
jgi:hypothetical protein